MGVRESEGSDESSGSDHPAKESVISRSVTVQY
ncbi:hypothetical protein POX_d04985 [Penicillium oxalicum]|nr:hypothetical protein POX_d04985 [Penicillium oxalicum]KAI2789493.1 hypothetical protein POX_d04985 [Penicillium oxalicum]